MFKFLVVEDVPEMLVQLENLLREAFEGCDVAAVATISDGAELIESAYRDGWAYDAAILDFRLPRHYGDHTQVDSSLSRKIRELGLATLVAHVTGYTDDPEVQDYVWKAQVEQPNPRAFTLSKNDKTYARTLVAKLRTILFSSRIERQLTELFGVEMTADALFRREGRRGSQQALNLGTTHRLAGLLRDIESHWPDLDPVLRKRIRDIMNVDFDVSSGTYRVSLL